MALLMKQKRYAFIIFVELYHTVKTKRIVAVLCNLTILMKNMIKLSALLTKSLPVIIAEYRYFIKYNLLKIILDSCILDIKEK